MLPDISDAVLTLAANGTGTLSKSYSLTCTATINEDLIGFSNNITLEKVTDDGYVVLDYSTSTSSIAVDLSPLTTADVGVYRCSFDSRQADINYQRTYEQLLNISVTSKTNTCTSVYM